MGEVPLCSSLRGLLFHTCAASYEMVSQSSLVSTAKNFRWPRRAGGDVLLVDNNWCWFPVNFVSCLCMSFASHYLMVGSVVAPIVVFLYTVFFMIYMGIHTLAVHSVIYWYRDVPFRLIGAKVKFMIEVVPMIIAAALHHLFEFDCVYPVLLLGCITYFYFFAHFLHAAYDIWLVEALLGSTMPVLFYMVEGDVLVRALALSICVALCFCKYMMYSAPEVPEHSKKRLPC